MRRNDLRLARRRLCATVRCEGQHRRLSLGASLATPIFVPASFFQHGARSAGRRGRREGIIATCGRDGLASTRILLLFERWWLASRIFYNDMAELLPP